MNVLVVMADDMRWDLLRYMPFVSGNLRKNGIYFPNSRHSVPICQAARIGLLTGQNANGALNGAYQNSDGMGSAATDSIGIWLQAAGVETGFVGKCPNIYRQITPRAGWSTWNIISSGEQYPYTCKWTDGLTPGSSATSTEHEVIHGANLVIDFFQNASSPWFCWWTPTNPHVQLLDPFEQNPLPKSMEKFTWKYWVPKLLTDTTGKPSWISSSANMNLTQRARMQKWIKQQIRETYDLDTQIERVYNALVADGIDDETMIIFTSDNGAYYAEQNDQNPLGSSKDAPYDPAARVPVVVFGGGGVPGTVNISPVNPMQDITATLLDVFSATGVDPDGTSLVELINNPQPDRATLYLRKDNPTDPDCEGVFTKNRKLMRYIEGTGTPAADFTANPDDQYEMYYLDDDPDELVNRANLGGADLTERNRLEVILDDLLV